MSIRLDSTDYIARTANMPDRTTGVTLAGWFYLHDLPAAVNRALLSFNANASLGGIRWNGTVLRLYSTNFAVNFASNPTAGNWYYIFVRATGSGQAAGLQGGWMAFEGSSFTKVATTSEASGTLSAVRVGANSVPYDSLDVSAYRVSLWDEYVSDENLLLAAATDKGYTTNLNTHIPGTATGDPARYADTSGNGRNWTASGTITDASNGPFDVDQTVSLAGSSVTPGHGTQSPSILIAI